MAGPYEQAGEHPPVSLKDFYDELRKLAERGCGQPYDLAVAEGVESLVLQHLSVLKNALVQEQAGMLRDFVAEVADLGKRIPISDFDDEGFLTAFGFTWGVYLERHLRHPVGRDFFAITLDELATRSKEHAALLAGIRQQHQELTFSLTQKEAQLPTADFKQRRELSSELASLKNSLGEVEHYIAAEEMDALKVLLPPNTAYEHLPSHPPTLTLDPGKFHPSAVAALFFWRDHPGEIEPQAPAEPAAPEPEPEPSIPVRATSSLASDEPDDEWYRSLFSEPAEEPEEPELEQDVAPAIPEPPAPEPEPAPVAPEPPPPPPEEPPPALTAEPPRALEPRPYAADCEAAVRRFNEAYRDKSPDLGTAIENVAFHWIDRGYVNVAHTTLKSAQFSHLPLTSLLSPDLFKAAYFGMNVWSKDEEPLGTVQRLLSFLSLPVIDELCGRRPGGPAVPYLLFAAGFQPALFGGAATTAPAIVEFAGHFLDAPFREHLAELLSLWGNDGALSLEVLRKLPSGDQRSARLQIAERLGDWRERILSRQGGWGPARSALNNCLARNDFDRAIQAMQNPESNDAEGVAQFVAKYRDRNAIGALLDTQIATLAALGESRPAEERNAKSWFVLNILDLCGIANDWLAEYRLRQTGGEASLQGRVLEPLAAMHAIIEESVHPGLPFEQQVGAKLAMLCLSRLRQAIEDRESSVVWSAKQTNAWLSLPYDMMEAVGFSGDAEGELAWLVDRLTSVPPAGE
jgi:hypothetical protein